MLPQAKGMSVKLYKFLLNKSMLLFIAIQVFSSILDFLLAGGSILKNV